MTDENPAKNKKKKPKPLLNDKQLLFVKYYVKYKNATRAVKEAGYSANGAEVHGCRLLMNPNIAKAIEEQKKTYLERTDLNIERVILEIKRCALANIADLYNENGELKSIHDLDEDTQRAITSLKSEDLFAGAGDSKVQIGIAREVKMADKLNALDKLLKHLGGYETDNKQKSEGSVAAALSIVEAMKATNKASQKSSLLKSLLKQ